MGEEGWVGGGGGGNLLDLPSGLGTPTMPGPDRPKLPLFYTPVEV